MFTEKQKKKTKKRKTVTPSRRLQAELGKTSTPQTGKYTDQYNAKDLAST